MIHNTNRRGQSETGPIQGIVIGLFLVVAVSLGVFNFISQGLVTNYDTPILSDESSFTAYSEQQSQLTESINETKTKLTNPESGATDIASALFTGGFRVLRDFIGTPVVVANTMITSAGESLGIPSDFRALALFGIIVVIVFAILALIMKVRA